MKKKLAFFLGSDVPASTQTLFTNLTALISDRFDIDFVGFYGEEKFYDDANEVIYDYPSKKGIGRTYNSSRVLKHYIENHDPDLIVLTHKQSVYCIPFLFSTDHQRSIIRLNGDTFNQYKDRFYESKINRLKVFFTTKIFTRMLLKRSLGVIVQTEYMFEECEKRGIDPQKMKILPLPIDTDKFKKVDKRKKSKLRDEQKIPKDDILALIIGTKSTIKRRHLLDKLLKNSNGLNHIKFMIIGDTKSGKKLSEEYDNVIYEGFVDHDSINKYYQAGDFLLHFSDSEGLPTTFQEATACGLPIIAKKANYNRGLNISKFSDIDELEKMLKDEVWKSADSYVTPGLSKEEYIDFFKSMIERKEQN